MAVDQHFRRDIRQHQEPIADKCAVSHAYAVLDKGAGPYPGAATDMHVPGEPGARTDVHAVSEPAVVLDNGCGVDYHLGADFAPGWTIAPAAT